MSYKESDIVYENGDVWVLRETKYKRYAVFCVVPGLHYSTLDSAYMLDTDGLSIAKARADYLATSERGNV